MLEKNGHFLEVSAGILFFVGFILRVQGLTLGYFLLFAGLSLWFLWMLCHLGFSQNIYPSLAQYSRKWPMLLSYLASLMTLALILVKASLWAEITGIAAYVLPFFVLVIIVITFDFLSPRRLDEIKFLRRLLIRSLVLLALGFLFYITPSKKLRQLYFPSEVEQQEGQLINQGRPSQFFPVPRVQKIPNL